MAFVVWTVGVDLVVLGLLGVRRRGSRQACVLR